MNPIIVRDPAVPSLPLDIARGSGRENNVETVGFQELCRAEIDMALKVSSIVVVVWGGGGGGGGGGKG